MVNTLPSPPVGFQDDLLRKLSADHSPEQQLWLSGFLYGLAIARHQPADVKTLAGNPAAVSDLAPMQQPGKTLEKVTVLFGSQTGNSKKVANKVAARVREQGWEVSVADLNDYSTKNLREEKIVLLVVSTQGEGDPPVSAEEFYKWLIGPRAPKLDGLQFAVCGLGDKSYLQFCKTGKDFDARFQALGATRLAERADCDVDFEEAVETWTEAVLESMAERRSALGSLANGSAANYQTTARVLPEQRSGIQVQHDRKCPFAAPVLEKIQLNGRGSQKETWHLELSLEGSSLVYEPGDSLGIFPKNSEKLVEEVLAAAKLDGDKVLIFNEKETPLREILREVELSVLTRDVLEKFADATKNISLKTLPNDPAALKRFFWGRNVADLLREFPTTISEEILLGFLRKMPPRLYSIASSLAAHPDEAHLTVAAVRYDFDGRPHEGVASTFLVDRILAGESVPVFIEHNEYFKLPADDSADIIMVGPGTGVAPFRAFVEERSERGSSGKNWLFFGNPHFETDFLYQTEWLNHLKRGTLDRLDVAFSRDQEQKIYVQHRLLERSRLIFERLENGAFFYVCGDKERMASDVQNAVLQIIEKESGRDGEFAAEYLRGLKKQRRYLEDVY